MAKRAKKSTKKPAKKATKKPAKSRKVVSIRRRPKDQPLPGMEQIKSAKLSKICGSISDVRESINEMRTQEKALLGNALAQMKAESVLSYTDHGVELIRTTTEKIRVRLVSDDNATGDDTQGDLGEAEAESADAPSPDAADDDTPF
jgi:hypothetical protein